MAINDIVAEQAQRGEIDPEFARSVAGPQGQALAQQGQQVVRQGGQRMAQTAQQQVQPRQRQAPVTSLNLGNVTQMEKTDIQFWLDIGMFVLLALIFLKV